MPHGHFWINDEVWGVGVPSVSLGLWLFKRMKEFAEADIFRIRGELQAAGLPELLGNDFEEDYKRKVSIILVAFAD